jgi:hypothetical protein
MPHTVESTIHFSEKDLARGALDLSPEPDFSPMNTTLAVPVNKTVLETAVSIVKDAGPKVIETIVNQLVPAPHYQDPELTMGSPIVPVSSQLPTVFMAPPVETIIIVPPSNHSATPSGIPNSDTVRLYFLFFF